MTLHVYQHGDGLPVFWHHGTPNIGAPPAPLFPTSDRLGLRWISYDRPGYGGSTPRPGRTVASAADDVAAIADDLGIDTFAVMGHSGGGPHAMACAALMPDRVVAVVTGASMAPFDAEGLDWFAGMGETSAASLRAAAAGRAAKEAHVVEGEPDFTPDDWDTLNGSWSWLMSVVGPAIEAGPAAAIDDDLAYVTPWGFDPTTITAPMLILHGAGDRMIPSAHGEWLAAHCPTAELRIRPAGHLSILPEAHDALAWLRKVWP